MICMIARILVVGEITKQCDSSEFFGSLDIGLIHSM